MPQGGVDEGEDFVAAMKRELIEETSIKNIKILSHLMAEEKSTQFLGIRKDLNLSMKATILIRHQ